MEAGFEQAFRREREQLVGPFSERVFASQEVVADFGNK
jgi:hypothetical protein